MKLVEELINGQVGDILTLSDSQTCAEFRSSSVDFEITGKKIYKDPKDRFIMTAYEIEGPNVDTPFMVVIKEVDDTYDVFVYYLDTSGELDGDPGNPFYSLLDDDKNNLEDRIEVTVHYEDGENDVVWDMQDQTHGVLYSDSNSNEGIVTLAEYYTEDDNHNNNFCLVEWKGNENDGEIDMWYGCSIKDTEAVILPVGE